MSYLIKEDFSLLIQSDNLSAVIRQKESILSKAMAAAEAQVISKLRIKYNISREFRNTNLFNPTSVYKAGDRIYLDASAYNPAALYPLNSLTLQDGKIWICKTAISAGEAFDPTKWTLLDFQYAMYFASLPFVEFTYDLYVRAGDKVWWKDRVYTALRDTDIYAHDSLLESVTVQNIPSANIAPDDRREGAQYWGTGIAYSALNFSTSTWLPELYWTKGDNRNSQIVNAIVDIALYHAHTAIAPRNIPDIRVKRYDDTILWLNDAAKGNTVTLDLPAIISSVPKTSIRWGGNVKNRNSY